MQRTQYSYDSILAASERASFRVEDVIGPDRPLDFQRPFLPEVLARVEPLDFLTPDERIKLNQIRGNTYLVMFGLVEEFILPFVLDHARPALSHNDARTRALLQFATEEAKHIQLFRRFREAFEAGFGARTDVIGPPEAIGAEVLRHQPLAVALLVLHIEWMTQRHYVDSVKDNQALCPQFKSLLKHHWMEEAQHAKLDTLMVEALADRCSPEQQVAALEEYLEIGGFIDAGLKQQVALDLEAFERATGRRLTAAERSRASEMQLGANRWTYLGSGMTHPQFLGTLDRIQPALRGRVETVAPAFC